MIINNNLIVFLLCKTWVFSIGRVGTQVTESEPESEPSRSARLGPTRSPTRSPTRNPTRRLDSPRLGFRLGGRVRPTRLVTRLPSRPKLGSSSGRLTQRDFAQSAGSLQEPGSLQVATLPIDYHSTCNCLSRSVCCVVGARRINPPARPSVWFAVCCARRGTDRRVNINCCRPPFPYDLSNSSELYSKE